MTDKVTARALAWQKKYRSAPNTESENMTPTTRAMLTKEMEAKVESRFPGLVTQQEPDMSFDPKCYELAEYFLRNNAAATEDHKRDLAQVIRDAIEDWPEPSEEYPDPRAYPLADNH